MLFDFQELKRDNADVKIKSNFHTHTYLCGHAGGTPADYAREAIACGLSVIGISDHCSAPVNVYNGFELNADNLGELYLPLIDEAKAKYGDRIKILSAVEIEYFAGLDGYYKKLLSALDYLVLGQHEYLVDGVHENSFTDGTNEKSVLAYFDGVTEGLRSGYFALLAHPDLIFYHSPEITPKIAKAFDFAIGLAAKLDIAVELNANGVRSHAFRYPTDMLIELCLKHRPKVVVSSDAHNPAYVADEYVRSLTAYARRMKLNLVDEIL